MQTLNKTLEQYSSIPTETVDLTKKGYTNNGVTKFLTNQFGDKAAQGIISRNDIGTARTGSILWFKDLFGRYRSGKIVQVDEVTGKVVSGDEEFVHHKFASKHGLEFNYKPCLYNMHFTGTLEYAAFPKGIVQGEMLAIALSGLVPEVLWLSAQGHSEIDAKTLASFFEEVPIFLFPKADSLFNWRRVAEGFDPNYVKVSEQFQMLYAQGNSLDLRKDAAHMRQAVAHVKSLLKESHDYFESTLTRD